MRLGQTGRAKELIKRHRDDISRQKSIGPHGKYCGACSSPRAASRAQDVAEPILLAMWPDPQIEILLEAADR
jgi:hypothetical protein